MAAWANSIGATGMILKYRVPRGPEEPKRRNRPGGRGILLPTIRFHVFTGHRHGCGGLALAAEGQKAGNGPAIVLKQARRQGRILLLDVGPKGEPENPGSGLNVVHHGRPKTNPVCPCAPKNQADNKPGAATGRAFKTLQETACREAGKRVQKPHEAGNAIRFWLLRLCQ